MTTYRVSVKWATTDRVEYTEFSIGNPVDPRANWLVSAISENPGLNAKPFRIHLGNTTSHGILKSEIPDALAGSITEFYTGPLRVIGIHQVTNKLDLGRLALQIERSAASIEGREPRVFQGLTVQFI